MVIDARVTGVGRHWDAQAANRLLTLLLKRRSGAARHDLFKFTLKTRDDIFAYMYINKICISE